MTFHFNARTHTRANDNPYLCARQQPSAINIYEALTFSVCTHFHALFSVEIYLCALYKKEKVRKPFSKCQVLIHWVAWGYTASLEKEHRNKTMGLQQNTICTLGTQPFSQWARARTHAAQRQYTYWMAITATQSRIRPPAVSFAQFSSLVAAVIFRKGPNIKWQTHTHIEFIHLKMTMWIAPH